MIFSFESRRNGYRSEWESHREVERSSPTPFAWFFSLWYPEIASSCTLLWSIFPLIRLVYRHLHRAALRRVGHHLRNSSFLSLILSLLERVCVFFSPVAIPLLLRLEAWAVRDPRWRRRKSCQPQIWTWCACVCVCSCIAGGTSIISIIHEPLSAPVGRVDRGTTRSTSHLLSTSSNQLVTCMTSTMQKYKRSWHLLRLYVERGSSLRMSLMARRASPADRRKTSRNASSSLSGRKRSVCRSAASVNVTRSVLSSAFRLVHAGLVVASAAAPT